jgi:hypothetical protein
MPPECPEALSDEQWEEVKARIEKVRDVPPSKKELNNMITPVCITESCKNCQDGWVELHHVVRYQEQEKSKIETVSFLLGECEECNSKFKIDGGLQRWS